MDKDELIRKLAARVEALEAVRTYLETHRPIPDQVHDKLLDTASALAEARKNDWVKNIGI